MNIKAARYALALAAVLAITGNLGFAGAGRGRSSTKSIEVTLIESTKLNNGTVLPPGDYTVKIPEDTQSPEVEFYRGERLVATAQVQVQARSEKNDYTTIEGTDKGDGYVITAIAPRGLPEKLVFSQPESESGL